MTLGLGLILLIICLPCICNSIIEIFRDQRLREEMGTRVVNGLAKRSFNPEQFSTQKECAICLMEFSKDD